MKKYVNGKFVDMTTEEIAEYNERQKAIAEELKNTPPTEAERLEAIEMAILELAEVLANG